MVATRCYLRTVRSGDEVRTAALYRIEGRGTNVLAAIPSQARWVQARVDGEDVDDLTVLPGTESRRIPLDRPGAKWPGIALLELEYASSGGSAHAWESPVLNIEVQTTFWEVVVTDSQALLGVPRGWSDENRWRWEKYIWMRKPWRTSGELVEWAGGSESRLTAGADPLLVQRSNAHAYLFRRMDQKGTVALPATIVSRSALVAICSGLVAMVGIGLLLLRPRAKSIGLMILGVVGLAAGAYEPNITLQAAQSGVLGLVLIVIAATLQWVVERRRLSGSPPYGDVITSSAQVSPQPASLSSSVGSDSSTAIRPRPIPAVDRIVLAPPNGVESLREPSSFGSGLSP
jgi:hypothetical protein